MASPDQNEAEVETEVAAEAEIRDIIERWSEALRVKDLDRMMTSYETDVIVFDATTPLQYVGIDAYRRTWRDWLDTLEGPIDHELRELAICVDGAVAFTHGLVHMAATRQSGMRGEGWLRWTAGWKRIRDKWLIVHEHVSAPFDRETGLAVLDARP